MADKAISGTESRENDRLLDDLLRCLENDWHISASWDGLRKFWCIELTEEGVRMRDLKQDENNKLRELVDYMTPIAWYGASERERDRMRELGVEE